MTKNERWDYFVQKFKAATSEKRSLFHSVLLAALDNERTVMPIVGAGL